MDMRRALFHVGVAALILGLAYGPRAYYKLFMEDLVIDTIKRECRQGGGG